MNTKDQIDRNIFEDMKECVRRAGLPVFLDPCLCDGNQNKFTSKIGQGSSTVHFRGSYDNCIVTPK